MYIHVDYSPLTLSLYFSWCTLMYHIVSYCSHAIRVAGLYLCIIFLLITKEPVCIRIKGECFWSIHVLHNNFSCSNHLLGQLSLTLFFVVLHDNRTTTPLAPILCTRNPHASLLLEPWLTCAFKSSIITSRKYCAVNDSPIWPFWLSHVILLTDHNAVGLLYFIYL